LIEGHDDIDILCDDAVSVVEAMKAFPRNKKDNGKSYLVNLQGCNVKLDVRYVGDGYYDRRWQEVMLDKRIKHPFGFYIMDKENYYYSLVYHGLLQKRFFAEDYRIRLLKMSTDIGFVAVNPDEHIEQLNKFMRNNGYKYIDPSDPADSTVYINFSGLPKDLIRKNYYWRLRRLYRNIKQKVIFTVKRLYKNN
jgi:hypothetical protein